MSTSDIPYILNPVKIAQDFGGKSSPTRTEKWWGYELTFYNIHNEYCAKLLHIKCSGSTSHHFHVDKYETLIVVGGTLTLHITYDKQTTIHTLKPGEAWIMCPGYIHKLEAIDNDVTIIEASTFDSAADTVRVA